MVQIKKIILLVLLFLGAICFAQEIKIVYNFDHTSFLEIEKPEIDFKLITRTDILLIQIDYTLYVFGANWENSTFTVIITDFFGKIYVYNLLDESGKSKEIRIKELIDFINNVVIE